MNLDIIRVEVLTNKKPGTVTDYLPDYITVFANAPSPVGLGQGLVFSFSVSRGEGPDYARKVFQVEPKVITL